MSEFALIEQYFKQPFSTSKHAENVVVGSGDDCAVTRITPGHELAFSIDTMVEGRHFPRGALGDEVAARAMRTALSDLAAMGAEPCWVSLALTLPEFDEIWLKDFTKGFGALAEKYHLQLIGGDTTRGQLSITITVHGQVEA